MVNDIEFSKLYFSVIIDCRFYDKINYCHSPQPAHTIVGKKREKLALDPSDIYTTRSKIIHDPLLDHDPSAEKRCSRQ